MLNFRSPGASVMCQRYFFHSFCVFPPFFFLIRFSLLLCSPALSLSNLSLSIIFSFFFFLNIPVGFLFFPCMLIILKSFARLTGLCLSLAFALNPKFLYGLVILRRLLVFRDILFIFNRMQ